MVKKGFTIIELLVVIAIIAMVATLSLVSYNGAQDKAQSEQVQAIAGSVARKADAYYAQYGSYPSYCQLVMGDTAATGSGTGVGTAGCSSSNQNSTPSNTRLSDLNTIRATTPTAADRTTVMYKKCTSPSNSAQMRYYDPTLASPNMVYIGLHGASSSAQCS